MRSSIGIDMGEETGRHPGDEEIEQYALKTLSEDRIPALEQHLLICHACQDRMAEADAEIQALEAEGRAIREKNLRSRSMGHGSESRH